MREKMTSTPPSSPAAAPYSSALRETVEAVVIALMLAFVFRTFAAENFVIPTGSMAPTLMGDHKDLVCPQCGCPYQVSASRREVDHGICPNCRYQADLSSKNPLGKNYKTYSGDRILVGKFLYQLQDPERWDLVVFHFPGDAKVNYIKRVVGLPGETIWLKDGDLYVRKPGANEFTIVRKPPRKLLAMLQLVYDNDCQSAALNRAGWPSRWQPEPNPLGDGWQLADENRALTTSGQSRRDAWIRYHHYRPTYEQWRQVLDGLPIGQPEATHIDDFTAYNSGEEMDRQPPDIRDLAVACSLEVQSDAGEAVFDLIKDGRHFKCHIDLASGRAVLSIDGVPDFHPVAETRIHGRGTYEVMFSNVDRQLLFWIDRQVVPFDADTTYPEFHTQGARLPDLSPVGIGARGAALTARHVRVLRDIYYRPDGMTAAGPFTFPLAADQFFMLGDNSDCSKDGRKWSDDPAYPGASYRLEYFVRRDLLIGKAIFIYWPHSWDQVTLFGVEIPFPFFPNFRRMGFSR